MDEMDHILSIVQNLTTVVDGALKHLNPFLFPPSPCGHSDAVKANNSLYSFPYQPQTHRSCLRSIPFFPPALLRTNSFDPDYLNQDVLSIGTDCSPPSTFRVDSFNAPEKCRNPHRNNDPPLKEFLEQMDMAGLCDVLIRENVTDVQSLRKLDLPKMKEMGLPFVVIWNLQNALLALNLVEQCTSSPPSFSLSKSANHLPTKSTAAPSAWPRNRTVKSSPALFFPQGSFIKASKRHCACTDQIRPIVRKRMKGLWPFFDEVFF